MDRERVNVNKYFIMIQTDILIIIIGECGIIWRAYINENCCGLLDHPLVGIGT